MPIDEAEGIGSNFYLLDVYKRQLQTYQEVVQSLRKKGRAKHLLLGNGFSMAYDAKIFSYNALSAFIDVYKRQEW